MCQPKCSDYEELNLSKPSEQQLYKNDRNFTLSVKETKKNNSEKEKNRKRSRERRSRQELNRDDVLSAVKLMEMPKPASEDDVMFSKSLLDPTTDTCQTKLSANEVPTPPPQPPQPVSMQSSRSAVTQKSIRIVEDPSRRSKRTTAPHQSFRKLEFDVVTVGNKRKRKQNIGIGIEWNK